MRHMGKQQHQGRIQKSRPTSTRRVGSPERAELPPPPPPTFISLPTYLTTYICVFSQQTMPAVASLVSVTSLIATRALRGVGDNTREGGRRERRFYDGGPGRERQRAQGDLHIRGTMADLRHGVVSEAGPCGEVSPRRRQLHGGVQQQGSGPFSNTI